MEGRGESFRTVCPHDCPDRCAIVGRLAPDGRVARVAGDPDHPLTQGFLCGKVTRYAKRVHAPDRVRQPLKRTGPKGSPAFVPVSWDEAMADIGQVTRHLRDTAGPAALGFYQGTGTLGMLGENAVAALFRHAGATVQVGSICAGESYAGWQAGAGTAGASDPLRVVDARRVLVWGCNATVSNMHFFGRVRAAQEKGAALVVVDAYETLTARKADLFVKVFPGTDGALAMGLARWLREQGAWDEDYLTRAGAGLEAFTAALADYPLHRVSALTRVGEDEIRALGSLLAEDHGTFIRAGIGMSRHAFGGHAVWAIAALACLRGVYRHPGGGFLSVVGPAPDYDLRPLHAPQDRGPARTVPVAALARTLTELTDPPLRFLLVAAGNPASTSPDAARVRAGLAREDLFTVVHEQFLTDTTDYADYVLPATTFLESWDLHNSYGSYDFGLQAPVIPPEGEAVSNFELCRRLAREWGVRGTIFDGDEAEAVRKIYDASPLPWSWDQFRDGRVRRLPHPPEPTADGFGDNGFGGRFRFHRPDFAERGMPEVPGHYESAWGASQPWGAAEFHLMSPPHMEILNSSFAGAHDGHREQGGHVMMHPDDAARLGLADGDEVQLGNAFGAIRRRLRVSAAVQAGVLIQEGVFWAKNLGGRGGVNDVTSPARSAMAGIPVYHEVRVTVTKAPSP